MMRRRSVLALGAFLSAVGLSAATGVASADTTLLNVSYDPTRELYKEFNAAFAKHWKDQTGETVTIQQSHGGSGKQARAVIDGLEADVVTLASRCDIDPIAKATGKIPADWQQRLPNPVRPTPRPSSSSCARAIPRASRTGTIWCKDGVQVITPNPKTSGGARWNYLAAWAYALDKFGGDEAKVQRLHRRPLSATCRCSTPARAARRRPSPSAASATCCSPGRTRPISRSKEFGADKFDIVVPSISILAEPPVAVVDGNVDAQGHPRGGRGLSRVPLLRDRAAARGQALLPRRQARACRSAKTSPVFPM